MTDPHLLMCSLKIMHFSTPKHTATFINFPNILLYPFVEDISHNKFNPTQVLKSTL